MSAKKKEHKSKRLVLDIPEAAWLNVTYFSERGDDIEVKHDGDGNVEVTAGCMSRVFEPGEIEALVQVLRAGKKIAEARL